MKSTKYQSDEERSVLIGMISNDRVLSRIHTHLKAERKPFRSRWSNRIAKWCLEYFSKYGAAPRENIEKLFQSFAETAKEEDTVAIIEKFLSSLSRDYEGQRRMNEDFVVDMAARYFNQVKIERLCQTVEADLLNKDVDSAHKKVVNFSPINLATTAMMEVLTDNECLKDALIGAENDDILLHYPGALGEFFGPHLQRDGFIAFLAPEKRGKSFWLIDIAWRAAILNKRKTLLYSVGDMSQRQMMKRLVERAARRPIDAGKFQRPVSIRKTREGEVQVRSSELSFQDRLSFSEARTAMKKVRMKTAHSSSSLLKMKCTPNSTTRVSDIHSDVCELIRDGWVPDVVVIDYADILLPESGTKEIDYRHQINETWKAMRRLSQEHHILVVTATQADAASYDSAILRRNNFSEDKRKLSHVTGMVGINQTEEEKEQGIFRLNWILLREGAYFESKCVHTAGSLALSNPAMMSVW